MICGTMLPGAPEAFGKDVREEYASLKGAQRFDVVYDMRNANPKQAALYLRLIHEGFNDDSVQQLKGKPRAVIVINGAAVRLIGKSDVVNTEEERALIKNIKDRVKAMAEEGMRIEGCLKAAELFKVDATTFPSDVAPVENAWISLAGYQGKGYSMIPVF
jgi:intracellular sulfur oxidation DsrE/DsrF family protein